MRHPSICAVVLGLTGCINAAPRPEEVAVRYVEQRWGREFVDHNGKGFNINVMDCGLQWCVQLSPAYDPETRQPGYRFGGDIELEIRKADLAVNKAVLTQ